MSENVLEHALHVPSVLRHAEFEVTPLTSDLADADHAAYVSSPDVIRIHSAGRWPVEGFTPADDLALVARHERDHRQRRAFTFALVPPGRGEVWGCLYLNPLLPFLRQGGAGTTLLDRVSPDAAMVTFWLRQDLQHTGLAGVVLPAVDTWMRTAWPVPHHVFRVLPDEHDSVRAMQRSGFRQTTFELPAEPRPYLWFEPTG